MHPLFTINNLSKRFFFKKKPFYALRSLSFSIHPGETIGIVGESGSGKTTLGKLLLHLYLPNEGTILFKGKDIFQFSSQRLSAYRKSVQMIFQNPASALHPRMTIEQIICEPLVIYKVFSKEERLHYIYQLLSLVALPKEVLSKYPHECSGGQLQRVSIARALALSPEVIVCDEPFTALDLPTAMQLMELIKYLQRQYNVTFIFISHDLHMIQSISDRIIVLYLGEIVEFALTEELFSNPSHPYTQMLLHSSCIL